MKPQDPEHQMTVDECIEAVNAVEIFHLAITQHDPAQHCVSPTGGCQSWADCEIAGRCLDRDDE